MKEIRIKDKIIGDGQPTFVIAEAANNHAGNYAIAMEMILAAKKAGVDAVKFQCFIPEDFAVASHDYYEAYKEMSLTKEEWKSLRKLSQDLGLIFIVDVFDNKSLELMCSLEVDALKIHAGDINNYEFIAEVAKKNKPIFLHTGCSSYEEIKKAVEIIEKYNQNFIVEWGFQDYPTTPEQLNLNVIKTLKKDFGVVAFADHTTEYWPSLVAISLGANVIERHFSTDREAKRYDWESSLEPEQLKEIVELIKLNVCASGKEEIVLSEKELNSQKAMRKWMVAKRDLTNGETLTKENVCFRRASPGIGPNEVEQVFGKKIIRSVKKDDNIVYDNLKDSEETRVSLDSLNTTNPTETKKPKVVALIAARMNSERMYGKPMKEISGKPIIWHVVERLRQVENINEIIICTSHKKENQAFVRFAEENGLKCFVGDEEDVLDRFYQAAKKYGADHIVRQTSENPLFHIPHIDPLIEKHISQEKDFSFMSELPTGCFVEVISFNALERSWKEGGEKHHTELLSLYINENKDQFKIHYEEGPEELQRPYRLTVDTPTDLELMRTIFAALYEEGKILSLAKAIKFLDQNPSIAGMNADIPVGTSRIW
jgi:N,N'-diacetyllegionaminate synthase